MPVLPTPKETTYIGVAKGRPVFNFGEGVPPKWLVKLCDKGKVVGFQFQINGKPLEPGERVHGSDI